MKEIIKLMLGIAIGLSCISLPILITKHLDLFYWWFTGVYIYIFWIMKKYRVLIGRVLFLLLGLSLIITILNLNEFAKALSTFSFIGVVIFLLYEYITIKK